MSPRTVSGELLRRVPLLRVDDAVPAAAREVVEAGLPALPVIDEKERLAGIFGEREFITALFPGYLSTLGYAGFVTEDADGQIDLRECGAERVGDHMNTEHVDVASDYSDAQLAEIFLHHRVLIVPVADKGNVKGVVTRADFFRALIERSGG